VQAAAETQDTLWSLLPLSMFDPPPARFGFGVAWTDQVVPFQAEAKVR
jgi:hypothetical protein